jgi:VWFA-related protein
MITSRIAPWALAAAVLFSGTLAVDAQDAEPEPGRLVEREQVRLVAVNLIAVDDRGNIVADLRAEDLEAVFDDEPLEIAGLESEAELRASRRSLPMVRLQLQPGSVERIVSTSISEPRYWVLLLDVAHDVPGDLEPATMALQTFVREDLDPGDYVAVISYTGEVRLEQTFTTDREVISEAIETAYGRPRVTGLTTSQRIRGLMRALRTCEPPPDPQSGLGGGQTGQIGRGTDASGAEINTVPGSPVIQVECAKFQAVEYFEEMESLSDRFFGALEGALRLAGEAPGVPTVFAISHGTTVHPEAEFMDALKGTFGEGQVFGISSELARTGAAAEVNRVGDLAAEQGVTLHFIDPAKPVSSTFSARETDYMMHTADPFEAAWNAPQQDLRTMAEITGGVFVADVEVLGGLRSALVRERKRYVLDVYAPAAIDDEDLVAIRVTSNRPGVRLVHRNRVTDSVDTGADDFQAGMAAREIRDRDDGEPGMVQTFLVGARQADLDYEADGTKMVADLSLSVRVETDEGERLAEVFEFFRHSRQRAEWEAMQNATLAIRGWLEAPPGDYRVVAIFRNARTGRQGRASMEVNVPGP